MNKGEKKFLRLAWVIIIYACSGWARADWIAPLGSLEEYGLASANGEEQRQAGGAAMLDFLPGVVAMTGNPPPESHLNIMCRVHITPDSAPDQGYATVLRVGGKKRAFIIAYSKHKLERPWATITLRGVFVKAGESHPTDEGTMDWAYVFDRNSDGKIDFFSFLVGPLWIPSDADTDLRALPPVKGGVQLEFFEKMRDRARNGFWHVADDNYDGHHDGVVARLLDDTSGWADGWVVVRDLDFDTVYDTCFWTEGSIDSTPQKCLETENGYAVPGKSFAGLRNLPPPPELYLRSLNQVVGACGLAADDLYRSPVGSAQDAGDKDGDPGPAQEAGGQHPCYDELHYDSCYSLATAGDARAQERLGFMYANGKGVAENYDEALLWFRKAVAQAYPVAEYNLGFMYYFGKGVAQDSEEAVAWFRKAAEHGDALAQFALGFCHIKGEGAPKDDKEAEKWIRMAAEQGHIEAQYRLGAMYFLGRGVQKDPVHAWAWWAVASANGSVQAREGIARISPTMSKKQIARARKLAEQIYARVYP